MQQANQLTFSSAFLSTDLSLPKRVTTFSISALSLWSFCKKLWRLVTFSWSSFFSLCSCWEVWSSASCCCFRLWDTVNQPHIKTVSWPLYLYLLTLLPVWLTSFSVLLCFSSSEMLKFEFSWTPWRFWFCSVSVWFSLLLSERASRVLSRRSYGHTHIDKNTRQWITFFFTEGPFLSATPLQTS